MKRAVMCILPNARQAEEAVIRLGVAGFPNEDISVLLPNAEGTMSFSHAHHTMAPEGAVAGVGGGGFVGGALGVLAGIGLLVIPGLGPLIAAGPLMAALGGLAAGAAMGGVTGALVGMGIPELSAQLYEGKLKAGNLLISVHAESESQMKSIEKVFEDLGGESISNAADMSGPKESIAAE